NTHVRDAVRILPSKVGVSSLAVRLPFISCPAQVGLAFHGGNKRIRRRKNRHIRPQCSSNLVNRRLAPDLALIAPYRKELRQTKGNGGGEVVSERRAFLPSEQRPEIGLEITNLAHPRQDEDGRWTFREQGFIGNIERISQLTGHLAPVARRCGE